MDLQSFIKETIVQIAHGIEEAGKALEGSSAMVNPRNVATGGASKDSKVYGYVVEDRSSQMQLAVQSINFDVAVSVAQGSETKGGLGLMVGVVALGTQGKSDSSNSSQSRIQFSIPMVFPSTR